MKIPFFFTQFNYDTNKVSDETGLKCEDVSLAVQSERDECDINTIVRRFGLTGQLPQGVRAPTYDDFTGVSDYQSALAAMNEANDAFYQMPAEVRSRFDNDPHRFVEFCSDAVNASEMESLGLTIPKPFKEPPNAPDDVKIP